MIQHAGAAGQRAWQRSAVPRDLRTLAGSCRPDKYRGNDIAPRINHVEQELAILLLNIEILIDITLTTAILQLNRTTEHILAMSATMKAVNYSGPFKVTVQDVEKPGIEHPDDVIVKVTTSGERNEELDQSKNFGCLFSKHADLFVQQSAGQICTCTKAAQELSQELRSGTSSAPILHETRGRS